MKARDATVGMRIRQSCRPLSPGNVRGVGTIVTIGILNPSGQPRTILIRVRFADGHCEDWHPSWWTHITEEHE